MPSNSVGNQAAWSGTIRAVDLLERQHVLGVTQAEELAHAAGPPPPGAGRRVLVADGQDRLGVLAPRAAAGRIRAPTTARPPRRCSARTASVAATAPRRARRARARRSALRPEPQQVVDVVDVVRRLVAPAPLAVPRRVGLERRGRDEAVRVLPAEPGRHLGGCGGSSHRRTFGCSQPPACHPRLLNARAAGVERGREVGQEHRLGRDRGRRGRGRRSAAASSCPTGRCRR